MKRILILLILLMGCAETEDSVDPVSDVNEQNESSDLLGIELPSQYDHTFALTTAEWILADLPLPNSCLYTWMNTRIIFAEWDEFEKRCGGPAASKRQAGEVPEGVATFVGCTWYDSQAQKQYVTMDLGVPEVTKHQVFAHEVIHTLGRCSGITSDSIHEDDYRWKVVLPRVGQRLKCSEVTEYGQEGVGQITCF